MDIAPLGLLNPVEGNMRQSRLCWYLQQSAQPGIQIWRSIGVHEKKNTHNGQDTYARYRRNSFFCTLRLIKIFMILYNFPQHFVEQCGLENGAHCWNHRWLKTMEVHGHFKCFDNQLKNTINACLKRQESHQTCSGTLSCTNTKTQHYTTAYNSIITITTILKWLWWDFCVGQNIWNKMVLWHTHFSFKVKPEYFFVLTLSLWCITWLSSAIVVEKWHHLLLIWSPKSPVFTMIFSLLWGFAEI